MEFVDQNEKTRRKGLLLLLILLSLLLFACCSIFFVYIQRPAPLPELILPQADVNYPPHYLFSIYGIEKPVGVTLSPQGNRLYVTESGGDRQIQIFDRNGRPIGAFSSPKTSTGERAPVYLATDPSGRVYVTDRSQHAVIVFDANGTYLDTFLGPDTALSEYVSHRFGNVSPGTQYAYNLFHQVVYYQPLDEAEQTFPAPDIVSWSPLGIRIDTNGIMLLTDVTKERNSVRQIGSECTQAASWQEFDPPQSLFGATGTGEGEFTFPNSAMADSEGRIYVSDGNNGRISVWDTQGNFLFNFGSGNDEGALSLPRGLYIDQRNRLFVVDAVAHNIKVYDVSNAEPAFLYSFGDWGIDDGLFNYPNDIVTDDTGRLYIVDRENHRVQVWSY